jgi:two-component system, OmpR family, phosphate regulon sensor histidine kinase PhoR
MHTHHGRSFGRSLHQEQELRQARDFYAVLLGMAGHDLRQPLQVIQNTYDWLAHHLPSAPGQGRLQLERGERAIARLTEQLDRIVGALRLYEHTATMTLSTVELGPLFAALRAESHEFALANGVEVCVLRTRAAVVSNPAMLDAIVSNLVRNAIKYTPAGGRILIGCRRRGPDVRIDICDTGIGIAPDQVPEAFEAFQRLDTTRTDGLGLGLYVVRRAVALLGHRIEVRSMTGRGSRFSIFAHAAAEHE